MRLDAATTRGMLCFPATSTPPLPFCRPFDRWPTTCGWTHNIFLRQFSLHPFSHFFAISLLPQVGYHVRLDAATTRDTRLLFCTTGILLRRLAGDPALLAVSHVLVDEVHERTLQGEEACWISPQMTMCVCALLSAAGRQPRAGRRSTREDAAG